MWGEVLTGTDGRDRLTGQSRQDRPPAPLARGSPFLGWLGGGFWGFGLGLACSGLRWAWVFGGGSIAARIRKWLFLPRLSRFNEWAAGNRPLLAGLTGACRHQSPAFLLGGLGGLSQALAGTRLQQRQSDRPASQHHWAVVSALFRKSSYRFKRAAGPCSGRYVSRHPRGRRRWPASGRGVHWDKIVDWENKLGTIGRWR